MYNFLPLIVGLSIYSIFAVFMSLQILADNKRWGGEENLFADCPPLALMLLPGLIVIGIYYLIAYVSKKLNRISKTIVSMNRIMNESRKETA